MAHQRLKAKIKELLKEELFPGPDDLVDVSDGPAGDIHVVVVSRKFDGRRMLDRHNQIWDALEKGLTRKEWGRISLTMGVSPEQVKAAG